MTSTSPTQHSSDLNDHIYFLFFFYLVIGGIFDSDNIFDSYFVPLFAPLLSLSLQWWLALYHCTALNADSTDVDGDVDNFYDGNYNCDIYNDIDGEFLKQHNTWSNTPSHTIQSPHPPNDAGWPSPLHRLAARYRTGRLRGSQIIQLSSNWLVRPDALQYQRYLDQGVSAHENVLSRTQWDRLTDVHLAYCRAWHGLGASKIESDCSVISTILMDITFRCIS